ncbi:MAG: HetP family heterocyst commitment protein [Coleofasciculus sp. C3-bin4]|nr:HetP family heterocyst commitment protein [Coleofasciculus sp. C3-bin4]
MHSQMSYSRTKLDKTMNPEQFNQVVEAILAGKYSWACVLILRFAGYNPLHYIPYRTYNRLVKENCQIDMLRGRETNNIKPDYQRFETRYNGTPSRQHSSKITDLDYLEAVNEQHAQIRGGNLEPCLESNPLKIEWLLTNEQGFPDCN